MNKPLLVILTDSHLKKGNESQIKDIFRQAIEKAIGLGLNVVYFAGDWFDSRKYQGLSTLKATIEILNMFSEKGVELRIIAGNHDKPNYKSEDSYLDVFQKWDSMTLIRDYGYFDEGDVRIHMIPFFDEKDTFHEYLDMVQLSRSKKNILITHVAVDGVRNNDGSTMEGVVGLAHFTDLFDYIYIGHYHDYQELAGGKIIYIGSSHQHNYGEDELKGLTIVNEDLTIDQFKFNTKEFKVVHIDLNTATPEQVQELVEENEGSEDNVRFKFHGAKEKLESIDKKKLERVGIDVKCKADEVDVDLSYTELEEFEGFDAKAIIEEWLNFAERKEVSEEMTEKGKERLTNLLVRKVA